MLCYEPITCITLQLLQKFLSESRKRESIPSHTSIIAFELCKEDLILQAISVAKEGDSKDISNQPVEDMSAVGITAEDGEPTRMHCKQLQSSQSFC